METKGKVPRQQRIHLPNYTATLEEGSYSLTGVLQGVSLNGLQVNICSKKLQFSEVDRLHPFPIWRNKKFKIIISQNMKRQKHRMKCCSTNTRKKIYDYWL